MNNKVAIDEFWREFLVKTNREKDTKYMECFHFELTEKVSNELLELVLSGQKQATSSSLPAYQNDGNKLPEIGDLNIVTDWAGNPRCVIETTNVIIIPFKDMTYDICKLEGEDDSLESWKRGHTKFFSAEGEMLGYTFTEDMPVIFEEFKMIFRK